MRKKTAGLAALICAAGLISVTQTDTVLAVFVLQWGRCVVNSSDNQ